MENGDFADDDFMNEEFGAEEFESVFLALLPISAVLALLTLRVYSEVYHDEGSDPDYTESDEDIDPALGALDDFTDDEGFVYYPLIHGSHSFRTDLPPLQPIHLLRRRRRKHLP